MSGEDAQNDHQAPAGAASSPSDIDSRIIQATKQRDFLRALLDSPDAISILVVDTEPMGQIRFINRWSCFANGVSYEKALTMNAYDFASVPDSDIEKINSAIGRVLSGQGPVSLYSYFRRHVEQTEDYGFWGLMIVTLMERENDSPCLVFTTLSVSDMGLSIEDFGGHYLDNEKTEIGEKGPDDESIPPVEPKAGVPRSPVEVSLIDNPDEKQLQLMALEKETEFLTSILDSLSKISFMACDTEPLAQVRFANSFFCLHNDVTYEQAITSNAYDFASTPDDDINKINDAIARVMAGEGPVSIHGYFRSKSKSNLNYDMRALMIISRIDEGPYGTPCLLFITIDLADKNLKVESTSMSAERVRAITTTINDGVALLNEKRIITFWNVAAEKMFGLMAYEAVGRRVEELVIPEREKERFLAEMESRLDVKKPSFEEKVFETRGLRKDGSEFPTDVSANLFRQENNLWGAVLLFRDITKRKEAEEKLRQAKEAAEEANKIKDKFVTLVSHDLRAPLGNIMGMLEILKGKVNGVIKDADMFYLTRATENCYSLVKMIDRLLDISRLRTGHMRVAKRFMFTRYLLEDCISRITHSAMEKGIEIHMMVPPGHRIFADEHLFSEVIQNLVGNAVKFLGQGDKIEIMTPGDRPGTIVVSDNGPGIPTNILPNIFLAHKKTSTRGTMGEKGMGLGLPLCHDIMKAHGGEISVESQPGAGAIFTLTLPQARPTVLVADDNEAARMDVVEQLRAMNVDVIEAANGREALDRMAECAPHLVITDIRMPQMDGFALLEFIRKSPALDNLPVIVFTSSDEIDAREKAFRMGANDFVMKPVVANDFIPRVRRFVKA